MIFKELLIFSSGVAIGVVLGISISDRRYNERFEEEVEKRIDEIMDEKEKEEKAKAAETSERVLREKVQYNNIVGSNYNKNIKEGKETEVKEDDDDLPRTAAEYEHPEDDDEVAENPYYIDEDDFDASNGYDKESLYWYKANNTLVNDSDEVLDDMDDVKVMIGTEWASYDGYGVVYIRNEKLRTDYELVINLGSYPVEVPFS